MRRLVVRPELVKPVPDVAPEGYCKTCRRQQARRGRESCRPCEQATKKAAKEARKAEAIIARDKKAAERREARSGEERRRIAAYNQTDLRNMIPGFECEEWRNDLR